MKLLKNTFFALMSVVLVSSCNNAPAEKVADEKVADEKGIIFPRPFAFAIDDFGWNIGNDAGDVDGQGPYRLGMDRKMELNDYKYVVDVTKAVGVRVQGLFIMSEMDRENILGVNPTVTYQGKNWDNSKNVCDEQLEIMKYVQDNAAYLEFGLHGLGHEYWVDGKMERAEWYCKADNHPWPKESLEEHVQLFKDIMAQYGLDEEHGQSFPESFVPCSYSFHWNPEGSYSTGTLLGKHGVKYANTDFSEIPELNPPAGDNGGGFDHGIVVLNRINYGNLWFQLAKLPTVDLDQQGSSIIESHWTNWLAQDDFLQPDVTKEWIEYYKMVQRNSSRYVAKNTEQFYSQWLYNKYTTVNESEPGKVHIDNTKMPKTPYGKNSLGNLVLKIKIDSTQHIQKAEIDGSPIACYFEDEGYAFLYLPVLKQKSYDLSYEIGDKNMDTYIFNKGTYNVYSFSTSQIGIECSLRLYGEQTIDIFGCKDPKSISVENKDVTIQSYKYDAETKLLQIELKALDMQGETTALSVAY